MAELVSDSILCDPRLLNDFERFREIMNTSLATLTKDEGFEELAHESGYVLGRDYKEALIATAHGILSSFRELVGNNEALKAELKIQSGIHGIHNIDLPTVLGELNKRLFGHLA